MDEQFDKQKSHKKRHSGRSADKKAEKNKHVQEYTDKQRNPKAFTFKSAVRARNNFHRKQNLEHKKHHIPVVDRTPLEPPPVFIAIVGGPCSGKSTLMRSLIKIYSKQRLTSIAGPVTVVSGKKRRVTLFEVNNDINCMIDIAKVADIVLLLIDITFGIEMEAFEFLSICKAHGTPKIMGVLNHIDLMKDNKALKKQKKAVKHRFQVELYPGAKLFYLTGMIRDEYMVHEVKNLSRFIAVSKFRPLTFRSSHPYVVVDRWEDLTDAEQLRNPKCDRDVVLYGYTRGATFKPGQQKVHIPGCGDFVLDSIEFLPDPCPLPTHEKRRSLTSEEHLLYAPFSGVGGVVYDKDAVYIDLGGSQHGRYIKEQQEKEKKFLQQQMEEPTQHIGNASTDDHDEESHQSSENEEGDEEEDEDDDEDAEGAVHLMSRLQQLSTSASDGARRVQLFAGGEHVVTQRPEARYNNQGAGGLPSFESVVDKAGRVRRRALIPENEGYREGGELDLKRGGLEVIDGDEGGQEDGDSSDKDEEDSSDDDDDVEGAEGSEDEAAEDDDEETDDEEMKSDSKAGLPGKRKVPDAKDEDVSAPKKAKLDGNDAFSKIQSVLQSLEAEEDIPTFESEADDIGYSSADPDRYSPMNGRGDRDFGDEDGGSGGESEADVEHQRNMFEEARRNYYDHLSDAHTVSTAVYGDDVLRGYGEEDPHGEKKETKASGPIADDDDDDDGFLQRVEIVRSIYDEQDTSRHVLVDVVGEWRDRYDADKDGIKDCFVTGQWSETEDAQTLLKLDEGDMYGDFEDLETGQKFDAEAEESSAKNDSAADEKVKLDKSKMTRKERIIEKKKRIKARLMENDIESKSDAFDSWKAEMSQQAELNRTEFEGMSDEVRVQYEGFRAGMYVRLRFKSLPCEFVVNFDPTYPVIVGGLKEEEIMNVYNRVRITLHRWYPRILKTRDPLILSVGWRRLQTMMYYGKQEHNLRLRSLKYTIRHHENHGLFWGPASPLLAGFVAFQNVADRVPHFRIAATGTILEGDKSTNLVKKLKLLGHPKSVAKKTAYVTDMFHSETEVASFIGAKIQSQSGIRGLIKACSGLKGDFRAKFEDAIKMSDVVILKTWTNVEVLKYCSFVRSLLLTPAQKARWQGMKTVAQVKKEKNIKGAPNADSQYSEITRRREYVPHPLKVPRSLQAALPYKYKPKHQSAVTEEEQVLVVKDPHEEKMDRFMNRYRELLAEKKKQSHIAMKAKKAKYVKKKLEQESYRAQREKKQKTAACRQYSLKHPKKP